MNDPIPIMEGESLSDEERRLIALLERLEAGQLDFLDDAGKRLAELSAIMLGVVFGVTAFGDVFPPAYLTSVPAAKWLTLAGLLLYLASLSASLMAVQPRSYRRFTHNLSAARRELERIIAYKSRWLSAAGLLFFGGSALLACLVVLLLWTA
jgi:hypothetical protein